MIGIALDGDEARFLRELLHRYAERTFGPNSELAYSLYIEVDTKIKNEE